MENTKENQKNMIGLQEAISLVVGVVIGSGVFFKASTVLKSSGSPIVAILAWSFAGFITICSGLAVAEVGSTISKPGGIYAYLKELYGEKIGFLYGWVQVMIYFPAIIAALSIIFAEQATYFIDLSKNQQTYLAIGLILFLLILHSISTKFVGKIQIFFTIGKLLPLIAIIIFGLIRGSSNGLNNLSLAGGSAKNFGAALLGCLWAYDGWISVSNISGEMENAEKNLPKAIIMGLAIVTFVYVLFNIAVMKVMPVDGIIASNKAASDTAMILFGPIGSAFISVGILVSLFGALNGDMMLGSRMPLVMAQDKLLPFNKTISKIHPRLNTPINALILTSVIACFYTLSGSFDKLTNLVVFVLWIFFVMSVAGVFILRKKFTHLKSSYKVPLYPIVPLIGIGGGLYLLINTLITDTSNSLMGIVITLLGLPVYFYVKSKKVYEIIDKKDIQEEKFIA